jgi:hypothetical protein
MTVIYVGNLSDHTDAAQTRALFERYGAIASMRMARRASGHRFDGFGLIEMEASAAREAIAAIDGRVFDGAILSVHEATGAQQHPDTAHAPGKQTPKPDDETPRAITQRRYVVAEIEKVEGPDGTAEGDWYRYVLACGVSRITGFHRGSHLAEVTEYVAECATAFNDRNRRGKYTHPLALRRKK